MQKTIAAERIYQGRFYKTAADPKAIWWAPPCGHKHWSNYQDNIAPFWQQALRQEITAKDFQTQAARLPRGEA